MTSPFPFPWRIQQDAYVQCEGDRCMTLIATWTHRTLCRACTTPPKRLCVQCNEVQPEDEFKRVRNGRMRRPGSRDIVCKTCRGEAWVAKRAAA